jgi:putative restriction endonuclease
MIWLELRTNNTTYNPGWNFSESVWAPILTRDGSEWPFWNLINQVVKGDIIFHLRNVNGDKRFVGYSTASTDGYLTSSSPTQQNHEWDYIQTYYKVELTDFQVLNPTVSLSDFFANNNQRLRNYFTENRARRTNKKRLFYVIQRNLLQCLNGAYFSEFDGILPSMLIQDYETTRREREVAETANTGVAVREVEHRIGHQVFSDNVKANYSSKCCFPNCEVEGRGFLISGHIARWADNEPLRGHTGNGLCLCLMHDKAFEKGFFTLDENYHVVIVNADFANRQWLGNLLQAGENLEIKQRQINPLPEALRDHWVRIGYEE